MGTVRGVDSLSQDGIGISKDSQVVSIIGYTNLKKVDTGLGSDSLLVKDIFGKVKKISSINSLLGNYLPLTGGVISGSSSTPLEVNSNTASTFMAMKDNSGIYTYLGSDDGDFIVQTPSGGFTNKLVVKNSGVINTLSRLNINGATDNSSYQLNVTGNINASGDLTAANILSSTYTPTATASTNVTSVTTYPLRYTRVGNVVTVSGMVEPVVTTANTQSKYFLSLPISPTANFSQIYYATVTGSIGSSTASTIPVYGVGESGGIRVEINFTATSTGSSNQVINISYTIAN